MNDKLDKTLTIATILFYCESENTAIQAIEELREAAVKTERLKVN